MTQSSPENQDLLSKIVEFFSNVVENAKDMSMPLRFIIVFAAMFIVALVGSVAIPQEFVLLFYLLPFVGLFAYLIWEFQQWKAREGERRDARLEDRDERDYELEKAKLQYEFEDRKDERDYELERIKLERSATEPELKDEAPPLEEMRFEYLNWVRTQVSELSLLGVDSDATRDEDEGRLHLDQVYTALLTTEPETDQQKMEMERLGREAKPRSAIAQLDRESRLVLLGDPGSGKSTFINFVAMCLAFEGLGETAKGIELLTAPLPDDEGNDSEEWQPWNHGFLLPLRIILRDFTARGLPEAGKAATVKHLWDFVQQELAADGLEYCLPYLQAQFDAGQAILLLDGLDEVPEAEKRRTQIKQVVDAFHLKYRQSRLVVTSRTYAYQKQDWELDGFKGSQLLPFSAGQIRRFVDGWYRYTAWRRGMEAGLAQTRANTLKDAIFQQPRLYELAERPLLLTLMASLHAWRMGELPEDRQKLYEETVDLLLNRWERRQRVWDGQKEREMQPSLVEWLKTDRSKVRELLNELAYEAHLAQTEEAVAAVIPQQKLLDGLLALNKNPNTRPIQLENYLRDRAGLLAAHGEGEYTFPHRTFQEYLAACYFVQQDPDYPDSLAALARETPNKWREVLLLAGAQVGRNQVWYLVDELCTQDVKEANVVTEADLWGGHLAAEMLVDVIEPNSPLKPSNEKLKQRVKDWLLLCLTAAELPPVERAVAGMSLARLGDPREAIHSQVPLLVDVPAGAFLLGSDKQKDEQAFDNELPQREVTLPAYRIGQYPVTNAQFAHFMAAGGYENEACWTKDGWAEKKKQGWTEPRYWDNARYNQANQPVVGVSWYEAVAYCRWLKAITGRDFRLPDEAMWEKAARGTSGQIYPWGDDWQPDSLNWSGSNINRPSAVGIFPQGKSPYEAYDMCGNVWEWCSTVWGKYPFKARPYQEEIEGKSRRRLRGGAFNGDQRFSRAAFRDYYLPDGRVDLVGFRVAEHLSISGS